MEAISKLEQTEISEVLFPTVGIFVPLLEPLREEIALARKTFQYGGTGRHQLDIYSPADTSQKHPVLFFVYGGGFVQGDRTLPSPADTSYGNVGLYFAKRGYVTVIADYRLAPGTTYPGPAEDLRDALQWVTSHPDETGPGADLDKVFFLGVSAGAAHTLTLLFSPSIIGGLLSKIKGATVVSAPYHSDVGLDTTATYYGSEARAKTCSPLALLSGASDETIKSLPPLLMVRSEREPPKFINAGNEYAAAVKSKGIQAPYITAAGHNHISITFALGTGQGEHWAEETIAWMAKP
ncbi:unnamed protein product [Mycena citricolor]|uniref:BD-FAE-like domain-containing protein n=1 Tax=Mycena citricolor TaxID=2018698 RepID=A0AAD2HMJ5_9AGAR|nr:unnamed protein product [Mycena citricolor]